MTEALNQDMIQKELEKIPQENLLKFLLDWMTLAKFAQEDDYDDFELQWPGR